MHHLEYGKCYVTQLTEEEILNPFIVLKDMFEGASSPEHVQDELFEILTVALRTSYWIKYDSPAIVYKKYKRLIRLFEAGWLIWKIRPDHTTEEKTCLPYNEIEIETKGRKRPNTQMNPVLRAYKTLIGSYQKDMLFSYRSDLFELLFEGLMPSCVTYPFIFEGYIIDRFQEMEALIDALFILSNHEQNNVLSLEDTKILYREKYEFVARETLYIYDSHHDILHLKEYSTKADLVKALKLSNSILYDTNFWKLHGNPANMLYYFHDFLFVLEYYWIYYQQILAEEVDINIKWKYSQEKKSEIYQIIRKWVKKPWKYLHQQFKKKSIIKWRQLLECCLEDVLSNQEIEYERKQQYNEVLDFIGVLLVFNEILQYEPETA